MIAGYLRHLPRGTGGRQPERWGAAEALEPSLKERAIALLRKLLKSKSGVVQVKAGPVFCTMDVKVVSGGVVALRAAGAAGLGPLLVTVMV